MLSVLARLPPGVHTFIADVGWFSVFLGSPLDFKEVALAYRHSCELEWMNDAFVALLAYFVSSGVVLDVQAREVAKARG